MTFPSVSGEFMLASVAARPQLATDVPGAVDYTRQSRAQLYKDMRAGLVPAYKNGTRTILFFDDLDLYMRALPRAKFTPADEDEVNDNKLPAIAEHAPVAETIEGDTETSSLVAVGLAKAKRQLAEPQGLIAGLETGTAQPAK